MENEKLKEVIKNQKAKIYEQEEKIEKLTRSIENWKEATTRLKGKIVDSKKESNNTINIKVYIDQKQDEISYSVKTKYDSSADHKLVKYIYSGFKNNKKLLIKEHPELQNLLIESSTVRINSLFIKKNWWYVEIKEVEDHKSWPEEKDGYTYYKNILEYDYLRDDIIEVITKINSGLKL